MRHLIEEATFAADKIVIARQPQYGDSWRTCMIPHLLARANQKSRMAQIAYLADSDEALEEALDAINFLRFAWCRMKEVEDGSPT
jgi:hypothetical protein